MNFSDEKFDAFAIRLKAMQNSTWNSGGHLVIVAVDFLIKPHTFHSVSKGIFAMTPVSIKAIVTNKKCLISAYFENNPIDSC